MIQLTPQQANDLIARGNVDVIDVRDDVEWATGHLASARHAPLDRLRTNPVSVITRDRVVFVCAAGVRSQIAARIAEAIGLKEVYNLSGGTRAWTRAGLPMVRAASAA